jgi:hypothetical protein
MVGSIRNRRVFPDVFLSYVRLCRGRAEPLRVAGDLVAMGQKFQRSHPVYALDGGKYLRGHVFSAADAALCAAIPRLHEGNTGSSFRVLFGDCLSGSGSLSPRRKGSYLGAANCAALARGNLFRPNKGPRTLYQRMVSHLRPARRDRVGRPRYRSSQHSCPIKDWESGCDRIRGACNLWIRRMVGAAAAMTRSIQPNRESVLLTRPTLDPKDPQQRNILTATFYGLPEPYDPNIIIFRNATELGDLVRKADVDGKPLFINLGYLATVEGEHQNKYELLRNSGFFEDLGILSGFEPSMQSRHVFRYKPGSAAHFDFGAVPRDRGRPGT